MTLSKQAGYLCWLGPQFALGRLKPLQGAITVTYTQGHDRGANILSLSLLLGTMFRLEAGAAPFETPELDSTLQLGWEFNRRLQGHTFQTQMTRCPRCRVDVQAQTHEQTHGTCSFEHTKEHTALGA